MNKFLKTISISIIVIMMILMLSKTSYATSSNTNIKKIEVTPSASSLVQDENDDSVYRTTVDKNTTSVDINVTTDDSKASVSVSGNSEFQTGTNKVTITVTAEDGTQKEYRIYIRRLSKTIAETNIIPNVQTDDDSNTKNEDTNISKNTVVTNSLVENETNNELQNDTIDNQIFGDENAISNEVLVNGTATWENKSLSNNNFKIIICVIVIIIAIIILIIILKGKKHKSDYR